MANPVSAETPGHSPKSILALLPDAWNGRGGIAECMRSAIAALASLKVSSEIVVLSRHGDGNNHNAPDRVRWIRFAQRGKVGFVTTLASQLLVGRSPDLVFCGHLHLVPFALIAARRFGSPLLVYLHGIEAWAPPPRQFVRKRAALADRYVAVSEVTRNRFVAWSGIDKAKIKVIPNAVHSDRLGMGAKNLALVRRYGLEGKRVLMTMCRLDARQRHKGIDEVIEILPKLLERHQNLVFMIVGGGDDLHRLREKVSRSGTTGSVIFTGWIDEDVKADYLRLADAFTLAGYGDGFGIVLLEAMACGIPVVASSLDGSRDTVLGGKLGQIVDPGNKQKLADAVLRALELPKRVPPELASFSFETYSRKLAEVVLPMMSGIHAES